MLTAAANQFRLHQFAASVAKLSVIGKFNLAMRALHQAHPRTEAQCTTAKQECQAFWD